MSGTSWILGKGGLLGSAVHAELSRRGRNVWSPDEPLPWNDSPTIEQALTTAASQFSATVGDGRWSLYWCAGAGVVGTSEDQLKRESQLFQFFLDSLGERIGRRTGSAGTLFLASSAGGLYAGASPAPFTEETRPRPLSAYGWAKFEQESLAREWAERHGISLLVGRLSNLYGPGQDLSKNQGLITQVCRCTIARQPLILYVPLDTIRDYLFVPDAASMILDGVDDIGEEASRTASPVFETKILASQESSTVGGILAEVRRVIKRPISVVMAHSPNARFQVRDLRMKSIVRTDWDRRTKTTVAAGVQSIIDEILRKSMQGQLQVGMSR